MRFKFPRESYIPKGASKIASKKSSAVAYLSTTAGGKAYAVGFFGKADKPSFNYSFASAEKRAAYVAKWLQDMDGIQASKDSAAAAKKEALSKPQEFLKVGDVLKCSWGYDQTNIDYYQVIELVGKRKVMIREISCESVDTEFMQGKSVPMVGSFIGEPMLKVVNEYGSVKIASYASAFKMEPVKVAGVAVGYKPSSWTAYA